MATNRRMSDGNLRSSNPLATTTKSVPHDTIWGTWIRRKGDGVNIQIVVGLRETRVTTGGGLDTVDTVRGIIGGTASRHHPIS